MGTKELTIDVAIKNHVILKDKKAKITAEAAEKARKIQTTLDKIESWLMIQGEKAGVKSFKTEYGTAFFKVKRFVRVTDMDRALEFIKKNNKWEFIQKRVNTTAVTAYIDETGEVPDGTAYESIKAMSVRRSAGS